MRTLAAVALLGLVGCTTVDARRLASLEAQVQALTAKPMKKSATAEVQWGGQGASAPMASVGAWVPVQAANKSLLAGMSSSFSSSNNPAFGSDFGTATGKKLCADYPTCSNYLKANGTTLELYGNNANAVLMGSSAFVTVLPLRIGTTGTDMSDSYAGSSTIDFGSTTTTCNDSTGITVTGAAVNDVCAVGPPASGGSTNATYSCYVSAADTVKVRHCAAGTADDPASATFTVRVFDP